MDFRRLENDYKNVGGDTETKKVLEQLQKQLKEMQEQLSTIQAPNMHADERCDVSVEKCLSGCRLADCTM